MIARLTPTTHRVLQLVADHLHYYRVDEYRHTPGYDMQTAEALFDRGLIEMDEEPGNNGRSVYVITDAGRLALAANASS